ncbi:helix-turn-helix domain-containing protein [Richelia sinica]|uniref:helix-turn-helix domain-containing protein n=1 Tax=Richelia sinica TaxID=1357545 RepID=UPI001684F6F0|nr:helix-turn-helix domain-containing protein [Richelia sinica]MBD2666688.1 helix-turn-helix domain-containing protein [Richelia sinica FACHB-800]
MARIHQLFKNSMDKYGVQGKELAAITGVSTTHLSEFRNGKKSVSLEVFEELLEGMDHLSPGAKKHFCQLLAGEKLRENTDLIQLIDDADDETIDQIMLAIGRKMKRSREVQHNLVNFSEAIAV